MEVLYFVPKENFQKVKDTLLKDDAIARQSVTFRDAGHFEKKEEGSYIRLSGSDEVLQKAKDVIGKLWTVVEGKEREGVLNEMKKEEDLATEGFGAIFE